MVCFENMDLIEILARDMKLLETLRKSQPVEWNYPEFFWVSANRDLRVGVNPDGSYFMIFFDKESKYYDKVFGSVYDCLNAFRDYDRYWSDDYTEVTWIIYDAPSDWNKYVVYWDGWHCEFYDVVHNDF